MCDGKNSCAKLSRASGATGKKEGNGRDGQWRIRLSGRARNAEQEEEEEEAFRVRTGTSRAGGALFESGLCRGLPIATVGLIWTGLVNMTAISVRLNICAQQIMSLGWVTRKR